MCKACIGGILSIVAGSLGLLASFGVLIWFGIFPRMFDSFGTPFPIVSMFILFAVLFAAAPSVLAIIGGVAGIKRTNWGLALAGSIGATFTFWWVLGIAAIVLTALGRDDFRKSAAATDTPPAAPSPPVA